jgi:hypothetical protein
MNTTNIYSQTKERPPALTRSWLAWVLLLTWSTGGAANIAHGDLLQLTDGSPPFAGRLIEENAREVKFQVWDANGKKRVVTYPASAVLRVIRTLDPATLEQLPRRPPSESLIVAETLLAITEDAAATASGLDLLRETLARDDLEPALRQAVERLQVNNLRPGLARARWQLSLAQTTPQPSHTEALSPDDPWEWHLARLDEPTRSAWRQALTQDRHPTPGATPSPAQDRAAIPRQQLQQAIFKTEQALPPRDPRTDWCSELRATLNTDDFSALVTILRLELLLQSTPARDTPAAPGRHP